MASDNAGAVSAAPVLFNLALKPLYAADVASRPFACHIFDVLVTFGPLSRASLLASCTDAIGSAAKRGARQHMDLRDAQREYVNEAIDHGLERGWLALAEKGEITYAACPPGRVPLGEVAFGGRTREERARIAYDMLAKDDLRKARDLLASGWIRRSPLSASIAALRASLERHGLITPIIRWRPSGGDPIIIDGNLRDELCRSLGIEPRYDDLPSLSNALDALGVRMVSESMPSTKTRDRKDDAEAFAVQCGAHGVSLDSVADAIDARAGAVREIVERAKAIPDGRSKPDDADVDEFARMRDDGESLRVISVRTGFTQDTVLERLRLRYHVEAPVAPAPFMYGVRRLSGDAWSGTVDDLVREIATELVEFTTDEVWARLADLNGAATLEPRKLGPIMLRLVKLGMIEKSARTINSKRRECHGRSIPVYRSRLKLA